MKHIKKAYKSEPETDDQFIELTHGGALKIEKMSFRKSAIIGVHKPQSDKFGCIVILEDGSKHPAVESYDDVMKVLCK